MAPVRGRHYFDLPLCNPRPASPRTSTHQDTTKGTPVKERQKYSSPGEKVSITSAFDFEEILSNSSIPSYTVPQDTDSNSASGQSSPTLRPTVSTSRSSGSGQLTAELKYWRKKYYFLCKEYEPLLIFVHSLDHITVDDFSLEIKLFPARKAALRDLISALEFMDQEVVDLSPSAEARSRIENSLSFWNGLELEILDFMFKDSLEFGWSFGGGRMLSKW